MKIIKYFSGMEQDEPYICLENEEIYTLCATEEGVKIFDNNGFPLTSEKLMGLVGKMHLVKYVDFLSLAQKMQYK